MKTFPERVTIESEITDIPDIKVYIDETCTYNHKVLCIEDAECAEYVLVTKSQAVRLLEVIKNALDSGELE